MPTKYVGILSAFHAKLITKEKKSDRASVKRQGFQTQFCNNFIFKSQSYAMNKSQFAVNTQHVM